MTEEPKKAKAKHLLSLNERVAAARGKVVVRMPISLHKTLLQQADREGISLNRLCVERLEIDE